MIVGVEATAEFPEDRVPVHVLVWGVDEARWDDMDRLRRDLYELLGCADEHDPPCALAHPLHRVGGELLADHVERCLLLFRLWEGRNGARPRECKRSASGSPGRPGATCSSGSPRSTASRPAATGRRR